MRKITIFDSTLRDGAQSENISFSVTDKLKIVTILDEMGVDYIEAGNPGSNPKDLEFFARAGQLQLKNARLCAFGSTRRKNVAVEEDDNVLSLLKANTEVIVIFGKSWDLHIREILRTTEEENLRLIGDTVAFFKSKGKEVIYDAEHFFDGYKNNRQCALDSLRAAAEAGADCLCLCDTNGGTLPSEIHRVTKEVVGLFPQVPIGIHCHNDIGCAVANSVSAVEAGASQVQGTFIGIGERCGNADLSVIVPNLHLKLGYDNLSCDLGRLSEAVHAVSEIANVPVPNNKPYVGASAFAHKGGMHIDGVNKCSYSFEHIEPEKVGNKRRFLMSEVSGRTTVLAKVKNFAPDLKRDAPETALIVQKIKDMEHDGYQFESADASFELMVLDVLGRFKPHFKLNMYKTSGEWPNPDGSSSAYAVLTIAVNGQVETAASTGNGPVNALDQALRKALTIFYPEVSKIHLTDYKVRVLTAESGTAAKVRVLIDSTNGERVWTTVGVSTDIIQASWLALVDSIEYILNGL